jgi:hypothetical protein
MSKTIAAVGLVACLAACYNTRNVKTGALVCGPNDACPDGFTCIKDGTATQPGHCWRNGTRPDAGGGNSDTAAGRPDTLPPGACTTPTAPFGPLPSCAAELPNANSTCDPVCQAGCPCRQRCVVNENTFASFQCEASEPDPSTFLRVQDDCTGNRSDSCSPGSQCIADNVCPWLCYRLCRNDQDCPKGSLCSSNTLYDVNDQPVSGVFLCTPPAETCNPTGAASCATLRENFNCVFQAGQTGVSSDATMCDCKSLHTQALGASCKLQQDDCLPGLVCVDKFCRQICEQQGTGAPCPNGGRCTPVFGSTKYGACR